MSPPDYYLFWFIYLASSAVAMGCFWWLTGYLNHKTGRMLLRFPAIAILFTPSQQTIDPSFYSPAIAAAAMDFISSRWEGAQPHVYNLLISLAFSLLVVLVIDVLRSKNVLK